MRQPYLVLKEIRGTTSGGKYLVVAAVELDERILKALTTVPVSASAAEKLIETEAKARKKR